MIILNPKDGKKDHFVWKPLSDTKKNKKGQYIPVVLFPRKWADPKKFASVEIQKDGIRVAKLKFVYHWLEDKKPKRQVWRCEVAAKDLPKNVVVVAKDGKGGVFAWPIKDPTKRVD